MISKEDIERQYGAEMTFVIIACRVYFKTNSPAEFQSYIKEHDLDWTSVYNIIAAHHIRPVVHSVITKYDIRVNDKFLSRLKHDMMLVVTRNQLKVKQTTELYTCLQQKGVSAFFYKGVMLSEVLFGDYTSREVDDIDILIKRDDFFKTRDTLTGVGYLSRHNSDSNTFYNHMLKVDCEYKCAIKTGNYINKVEIHWSPTHKMFDVPVDNNMLFRHGVNTSVSGKEINILDIHDHILVMLIHHGVNDVWRLLKHLLDWAMVLYRNDLDIDRDVLNEKITKARLVATTAAGTDMCYQLFGIGNNMQEFPHMNVDKLIKNVLTFQLLNKNRVATIKNFGLQLLLKDNIRDKSRLILNYIVTFVQPSIRDIQAFHLPDRLHFVYYIFKPFRLVISAITPKK